MNELFKTAVALVNRKEHRRLLDPNNWGDLTKKEKRIALALDVLRGLVSKQYNMEGGWGFVTLPGKTMKRLGNRDAQTELAKGMKCNCCELGAMFLSHVYFTDKLMVDELVEDRDSIITSLNGIYTENELRMLESCYEGSVAFLYKNYKAASSYIQYYKINYPNRINRALDININIVQNNGEFIPAKPISHEHK